MAKANPFRFSTKYQDDESDLLYYGYRYYAATAGRWLSRDLIGERGGNNLYCATKNELVAGVDTLGLHHYGLDKKPGRREGKRPWPGVDKFWIYGETFFELSDHPSVEKEHGKWYVRGGYTSSIVFWYYDEAAKVHELYHVNEDELLWNEFLGQVLPYIDVPYCSEKKAECFKDVVAQFGSLYQTIARYEAKRFDCDNYERASGRKLGLCDEADRLKPLIDTEFLAINKRIVWCNGL